MLLSFKETHLESHVVISVATLGAAASAIGGVSRSAVTPVSARCKATCRGSAVGGVSRIWIFGRLVMRAESSNRSSLARTLMNFPVTPSGRGHFFPSWRTEMGLPRARRNASTLSHAGSDSQPVAPLKETLELPNLELRAAGHDAAAAHGNPALMGCTSVATLRRSPRSCTSAPSASGARQRGPVPAVLAWRSFLRGALPARKSRVAGRHWPWTRAGIT